MKKSVHFRTNSKIPCSAFFPLLFVHSVNMPVPLHQLLGFSHSLCVLHKLKWDRDGVC